MEDGVEEEAQSGARRRQSRTVTPGPADLVEVVAMREQGEPTIPTTIALERATNPFLRAASVEEFARLRAMKDSFG